jgi:hypothetical protein
MDCHFEGFLAKISRFSGFYSLYLGHFYEICWQRAGVGLPLESMAVPITQISITPVV